MASTAPRCTFSANSSSCDVTSDPNRSQTGLARTGRKVWRHARMHAADGHLDQIRAPLGQHAEHLEER
eukprot:6519082-Pyramimonas_sp.AAC.1